MNRVGLNEISRMKEQVQELLRRVQSTADFGYVAFDSINATNELGDNALHCVWNDMEAVMLLVENGVDVNKNGENGFTPLKVAAEFASPAIVEYLIAHGANPTALYAEETYDAEKHKLHLQKLSQQIDALETQVNEQSGISAQQNAQATTHPKGRAV
jgi:ankyrin repeat protein